LDVSPDERAHQAELRLRICAARCPQSGSQTGSQRYPLQPEAAIDILLYDPGMPAKKRPTPQDAITACQFLPAALRPGILVTTPSRRGFAPPGNCALGWCGPANGIRRPWRGCGSGSCPSARSAAGETASSSSPCWQWRPCVAEPILVVSERGVGSTSGTSSASSAWLRRTPTTARCWPVLRYLQP